MDTDETNRANNTIALDISATSPYSEARATEEIYPGHLVQEVLEISGPTVRLYPSASSPFSVLWAMENPYSGNDIDHPYSIGERVMLRTTRPGDVVLARYYGLGETVLVGTYVYSLGFGGVAPQASPVSRVVGVSLYDGYVDFQGTIIIRTV